MNARTIYSRTLDFYATLTIYSLSEHGFVSPFQIHTLTHTPQESGVLNITLWNSRSGAHRVPESRAYIIRSLVKSPASQKLQFLRKVCIIFRTMEKLQSFQLRMKGEMAQR